MSLGSKIANRRRAVGMTQQELAEKLDVSPQAVSSWERDEFLPETAKLKDIAGCLKTKISWLFEENDAVEIGWELHDAMFSVDNMNRRVQMFIQAKGYSQSSKAMKIMLKEHEGTFRKSRSGEQIPYIIHPLLMACHAFALDVASDEVIAAILLHDVVEDCPVSIDELDVSDEVKKAVDLVSFKIIDGLSKEESKAVYYRKIAENPIASIVKIIDRCNNVSTMATGFSSKKIVKYIDETEKYVLPLINTIRSEYEEYNNAAFLIKYQILSVMESLKRLL